MYSCTNRNLHACVCKRTYILILLLHSICPHRLGGWKMQIVFFFFFFVKYHYRWVFNYMHLEIKYLRTQRKHRSAWNIRYEKKKILISKSRRNLKLQVQITLTSIIRTHWIFKSLQTRNKCGYPIYWFGDLGKYKVPVWLSGGSAIIINHQNLQKNKHNMRKICLSTSYLLETVTNILPEWGTFFT